MEVYDDRVKRERKEDQGEREKKGEDERNENGDRKNENQEKRKMRCSEAFMDTAQIFPA